MPPMRRVLQIQLQVRAPPHIPAQPHLGANSRFANTFWGMSERDDCACVQAAMDAPLSLLHWACFPGEGEVHLAAIHVCTTHTHNEEPETLPSYSSVQDRTHCFSL